MLREELVCGDRRDRRRERRVASWGRPRRRRRPSRRRRRRRRRRQRRRPPRRFGLFVGQRLDVAVAEGRQLRRPFVVCLLWGGASVERSLYARNAEPGKPERIGLPRVRPAVRNLLDRRRRSRDAARSASPSSRSTSPSARSFRGRRPASGPLRRRPGSWRPTARGSWKRSSDGATPGPRSTRRLAADEGRETRQLGAVTAAGDAAG